MFIYILSVYICLFICVLDVYTLYEGEKCVSEIDGLNGTCVNWRRCLSSVGDIKKRIHPQLCSFSNRDPIVCCTDCELVNDTSNVVLDKNGWYYFKTGSKASDKCLEYTTSLDYNCTRSDGRRRELEYFHKNCSVYSVLLYPASVGGEDALRAQFPHMALLGYGGTLEAAQWLCGGSVISDRFILTAGHCIVSKEGPVKYVGLGILKRSDPSDNWQYHYVSRIITYPEYTPPSQYHDIALLATTARIKFSRNVLPACLSVAKERDTTLPGVATGWGALGHRRELADTLQRVKLKPFSEEDCKIAFPPEINRNLINGYDHTTQICYGDKKKIIDTCPGDSGGPIQIRLSSADCVYVIVGVTSFGTACGFLGSSGVYTRVAYYISWIENIVWP